MSNVVKLKKRALDYEQKKQFDKALDTYMQVLANFGEHVDEADVALFNRVGDLLLRKGNVASAVDHYERAVDLYSEGGFLNNANALCKKILRNAPGRSSVYYKLGRISAKQGFVSDAKQNFLDYADRMQRIGELEEAFRALKEFADLCPDQDDIRLMLAEQLVRGDRKAEAVEQLQILFEKFEAEGRTQEARATVERMKAIDPELEPRQGVLRPTPKANDLIFLDVNYDEPAGAARSGQLPTRAQPFAAAAHTGLNGTAAAARGNPATDSPTVASETRVEPAASGNLDAGHTAADLESLDLIETSMPLMDMELATIDEVAPLPGLSPGAGLDGEYDDNTTRDGDHGPGSGNDIELITGFEQTALGVDFADDGTIEPMADLEQMSEPAAPPPPLPPVDIDLALDVVDESDSGKNELTFIFPDDDADAFQAVGTAGPAGDAAAAADRDWGALADDSQRIEPLLQLPELEVEPELDNGLALESTDSSTDESADEQHGAEPESAPVLASDSSDPVDEEAAAQPASTPEPSLHTPDLLRIQAELVPEDWDVRRRLGEALLEDGDRDGGLAELEAAMLGFEGVGDVRSASAVVDEMIRVEPAEVRFHQKRVEYAVRANDRGGLAAAYFSLAESLLQAGDIDKSRAVYSRVLELTPGDARARSALDAIGTVARPTPAAQALVPPPSGNGAAPAAPAADSPPVPRARTLEPVAGNGATGDFINLSDWLVEDQPERNTRMVVDVREPETQEQVDFAEMLSMFKQGVAANMDESDHEGHYDLGVAYKEMGLLDEAISEFQKALRGTEQRVRTYEALGQCFVEKHQYQIAVTILSRALGDKGNTDDILVGVLYLLGYASETLRRWADAQRFYERVFGVDIDFRDVRERLAAVEQIGRAHV